MSAHRDGLGHVDELLAAVSELHAGGVVEAVRASVRDDPVVSVTVHHRAIARTLGMRVNGELILVSIDGSQALGFAWAEADEMATLAALVHAFCEGGFEVRLGSRNGRCYGARGPGFHLEMARHLGESLRSGKLEWRGIDQPQREARS